jgi:2-polyprenyl-3-methyl-5-hydroxy-6-metoxy-1,4-benzoquinol methylase
MKKSSATEIAASANRTAYAEFVVEQYSDGAPHLKHASLRALFSALVTRVYGRAAQHSLRPRVLDLGAGEGSVTIPFLQLGGLVTAVDISPQQLCRLQEQCGAFGDALDVHCEDVDTFLATRRHTYDIVVANSFLHHIPDYLLLVKEASKKLDAGGQFFSFQDPLRYDRTTTLARAFTLAAYAVWRLGQDDVWAGLRRRFRRGRGIFLNDSVHDNAEYHVTRNGVDAEAILNLLKISGFECELVSYFSTQAGFAQPLGEALGLKNTFAILATKLHSAPTST